MSSDAVVSDTSELLSQQFTILLAKQTTGRSRNEEKVAKQNPLMRIHIKDDKKDKGRYESDTETTSRDLEKKDNTLIIDRDQH